jgi:hypothetical protein
MRRKIAHKVRDSPHSTWPCGHEYAKLRPLHHMYCIPRPGAGIARERNRRKGGVAANTRQGWKGVACVELISTSAGNCGLVHQGTLGLGRKRNSQVGARKPQLYSFTRDLSSLRFLSSSNSFPLLTTPLPGGGDRTDDHCCVYARLQVLTGYAWILHVCLRCLNGCHHSESLTRPFPRLLIRLPLAPRLVGAMAFVGTFTPIASAYMYSKILATSDLEVQFKPKV